MTSKQYKALFVPIELHQEIKLAAVKRGISIIDYVQFLLDFVKIRESGGGGGR